MAAESIQNSLKQLGVRMTRQRRIILDLIDQSGQHLDVERLFRLARQKDPKLHYGGDQHYYETRLKQEHAHVICLGCGKVEEFFGEPLRKLRRQVESTLGYEVLLVRTEIGGYCQDCQLSRARQVKDAARQSAPPAAGKRRASRKKNK